ncbi:hypothetical protein [Kribbella shirazensis]|uniref:Uncharacterized protein n=1 Tax=Kribbella shirazensis TaxID=1105143 RepID=A0A7X5VAX4_9ACTN|nr:hypothetical protein [Kribbella shirazensis]NIK57083.1 hypothetical protein [Kribbella shirazensis]
MGERLPEAWMVEWHRNRRVEFPLRRWSMLQPPVVLILPMALLSMNGIPDMLDDGGGWRFFAYLLIAMYAGVVVGITCQLVTQRPALVVDHRGLHLGRRRFLPWDGIGSISPVTGPKPTRRLEIFQTNVWAKNLTVTQQHVNDLHAFRTWLDDLLTEHRQTSHSN